MQGENNISRVDRRMQEFLSMNLEYYSLQVKSNTEKGPGKNPGLFVFSYLIPQSSNNNWRPQ